LRNFFAGSGGVSAVPVKDCLINEITGLRKLRNSLAVPHPGRMKRPTLADIAAAAEVTVPTVSKVLNGRSDVSQRTRARVLELLAAAGYERRGTGGPDGSRGAGAATGGTGPGTAGAVPGGADRAGGPGGPGAPDRPAAPVGLVDLVMDGVEGSWATRVLGGAEQTAAEAGCDVVVLSARQVRAGRDWVERLISRGSTGAVLALVDPTPEQRERLAAAGVALVVLDPGVEPAAGLPRVGATNWSGGYAAVEHLVTLGHTRVAAIGGREHQMNTRARLDGYRSALAAAGIRPRAAWTRYSDWSHASGAREATALLTPADRPTAIFACSDHLAQGTYQAAADLGLSVPGDLSVVGFDDLPEARWLSPGLTTVRQPVREMAAEAVRLLLRLRETGRAGTDRVELSTSLVLRDSTAPPRP
jgi:LacI family transcriptional regulator